MLELFVVPGVRPDKILKLHQELGISSLAELEAAATEGRIRKVKGLGAALQTKILQNLSIARRSCTRIRRHPCWSAQLRPSSSRTRNTHTSRLRAIFAEAASSFPNLQSSLGDLILTGAGIRRS